VSNWCNVNHLLLTDWCHPWLNANYVLKHFVMTSFFLSWLMCIQLVFLQVFPAWSLSIFFRQWTKMMLQSLCEYFWATVFKCSNTFQAPNAGRLGKNSVFLTGQLVCGSNALLLKIYIHLPRQSALVTVAGEVICHTINNVMVEVSFALLVAHFQACSCHQDWTGSL